jgi:hypothetical protein
VFEIVKTATGYASTPTTLVNFNGTNGGAPPASLIADANGDLFGTTKFGGAYEPAPSGGTVFEIAKTATGYASTPATLVSFNGTNGALPNAGLMADANGNLFSTTQGPNFGTVFEIAGSGFVALAINGTSVTGTEGTAISGAAVATFTDANPDATASDFTATINWGDGSASPGTVVAQNGGGFAVDGTHTYAEEGHYTVGVTINDVSGGTTSGTSNANIADAALTANATSVSGTKGTAIAGATVATFTDANPNAPVSDFSATINWGDGTTTSGTVVAQNGGGFAVDGTHTYADEGKYNIGVSINDDGGNTASATSNANIADAALAASGTTVSGTEGAAISGATIATFTDANPNAPVSDFTATINWGDGSTTSGTVVAQNGGDFAVDGTHTYADEGQFNIGVTINDIGGSTASATSTATVADADVLTGHGLRLRAHVGQTLNDVVVATFKDSYTSNTASDFKATINWGDGITTAGVVTDNAGAITISGTHTYKKSGHEKVVVTLTDDAPGTATATATSTINVNNATEKRGKDLDACGLSSSGKSTDDLQHHAGYNHMDLADIGFGARTTLGYTQYDGNSAGVLTASDGAHKIALLGQYAAASFVMASDGHGGTLITDPPELIAQTHLTKPHG